MSYTIAALDELIRQAKALGFWDDVAHWEAERRKLTAQTDRSTT